MAAWDNVNAINARAAETFAGAGPGSLTVSVATTIGGWTSYIGEMFDGAAEGYWHYLTNPSAMDNDLEYTFYGALGVAAVSGGTAVALAGAPIVTRVFDLLSAARLTIPTSQLGRSLVLVGGGTTGQIIGGLTVNGLEVLTGAALATGAVFLHRNHDELVRLGEELKQARQNVSEVEEMYNIESDPLRRGLLRDLLRQARDAVKQISQKITDLL